jgi:hypothetical protein
MTAARDIVARLGLQPHPEGGHFRETWRAAAKGSERSADTAIYYLLAAGEKSCWHRVDADEVWHFYAGAPLTLSIAAAGEKAVAHVLGNDLDGGEAPQVVVPARHWQAAESTGAWTLVGCTVSPGFEFSGFEMAPPGFQPKSDAT